MLINFGENEYYKAVSGLWKYDYGQKLEITGLNITAPTVEVDFSLSATCGDSVLRVGVINEDGIVTVPIPDTLLEPENRGDYSIYVFVYMRSETEGMTTHRIQLIVKDRPKLARDNDPISTFGQVLDRVNSALNEIRVLAAQDKPYILELSGTFEDSSLTWDTSKYEELYEAFSNGKPCAVRIPDMPWLATITSVGVSGGVLWEGYVYSDPNMRTFAGSKDGNSVYTETRQLVDTDFMLEHLDYNLDEMKQEVKKLAPIADIAQNGGIPIYVDRATGRAYLPPLRINEEIVTMEDGLENLVLTVGYVLPEGGEQ